MKKKRSVGITILSIYMFAGGILFFTLNPETTIISYALAIFSIICGVALFRLFHWGRKVTVIYFICGIIYGCLYYSPVFHKHRVQTCENKYKKEVAKNYSTIIFNDKEISKAEYLIIQKERVEEEKKEKFNLPSMFLGIFFGGIFIFYLYRPSVKKQFEKNSLIPCL